MIGVFSRADQRLIVEEFFQLFKTPWEFYRPGTVYQVVIASAKELPDVSATLLVVCGSGAKNHDAGIEPASTAKPAVLSTAHGVLPIYGGLAAISEDHKSSPAVIQLGYDLFDEARVLLAIGQPVEYAHIPTLEIHIQMLRQWILDAGLPLVEIPPAPAGREFIVCLTHDIDFVGIRHHVFDHSAWGFLFRATVGAMRNYARGRLPFVQLLQCWKAAGTLPFVYFGWAKDFWEPFQWYLKIEKGLPSSYFVIPFKHRAGEKVPGPRALRRATAYDVNDIAEDAAVLLDHGCEIGVHGIDAWHSADKGREERAAITKIAGEGAEGIRMHWLLWDANTPAALEEAGYRYDSSYGYNDTAGYRAGTGQVFRPEGARDLLELPLHIQDGALFYPQKLDLTDREAKSRCRALMNQARQYGGVMTVLWHDRSHGPERLWGGYYIWLVDALKSLSVWFGSAAQVVGWFRRRREVRFERLETKDGSRIRIVYAGGKIEPPLKVRVHHPSTSNPEATGGARFEEFSWDGTAAVLEGEIRSRIAVAAQ